MNNLTNHRFFTMRAWAVHLYTSLGLSAGLLTLRAIFNEDIHSAFVFLGIALFIDATDGTLARAWKVTTWTPQFDGRKLDDITDYLNYGFIPLFMTYRFGLLSGGMGMMVISIVAIAAAYGFCQRAAKTTEGFFTGFPNFWNIIVLYLFIFRLEPTVNAIILLVFALLVFVPLEYVSFSAKPFRKLTLTMAGLYGVVLLVMVINFPQVDHFLAVGSLVFPFYYVMLSTVLFIMRRAQNSTLIEKV